MSPETVFLVDDDPSVRDAMSLLLSLQGFRCATFASAEDLLRARQPDWRGCVVADLRLGGMSGLDLLAVLREQAPALPVVIITAHGDVAAARQAFLNQAADFLEKPFEASALLASVQRAMAAARRQEPTAGPAVPGTPPPPVDASGTAPPDGSPPPGLSQPATVDVMLSPREYEVMELLVQGLHNRHIAQRLGISHRTVEVHKARVLAKLHVRSVLELVRLIDSQRQP